MVQVSCWSCFPWFWGIVFANFCGHDHPVGREHLEEPPKETNLFNMTCLIDPRERYKTSHPNWSRVVNSFPLYGCPLENLNTFLPVHFIPNFLVSIASLEFLPQLILRSQILCKRLTEWTKTVQDTE